MELIVVLSILAALTGMVLPIYHSAFQSTRVEEGVADFYATLQYAESISISEAREYRVFIRAYPSESAYWVERYVGLNEDAEKIFEPVEEPNLRFKRLPPDLVFRPVDADEADLADDKYDNTYYISFYPSGACDIATVEIRRDDNRYRRYEIETRGRSGRMEMKVP